MSKRPVRPDPHPGARINWIQKAKLTDGPDAVALASSYGLIPDDWQSPIVNAWLTRRKSDCKWKHRRCGLAVPRQNGKNGAIEVRELWGLVILGEQILHAAHEVKTTKKAWKRLKSFFGEKADDPTARYPELNALVREIRATNGQEGIFLHDVCLSCEQPVRREAHAESPDTICLCDPDTREVRRGGGIEFIARSGGSGRGFTVDLLVLDEAQHLTDEQLEAIRSTISSGPLGNSQVIYAGTPPDADKGELGEVFKRIRKGAGKDPLLAWIEYGVPDGPMPDLDDVDVWFATNPSLGLRHGNGAYGLDFETVQGERGDLSDAGFARERLGWWGETAAERGGVFGPGRWGACALRADDEGRPLMVDSDGEERVIDLPRVSAIGVGVSLGMEWGSIAAARVLDGGRVLLGVVDRQQGTAHLPAEVKRIQRERECAVLIDEKCADPNLIRLLIDEGVDLTVLDLADCIEAAAELYQEVEDGSVAHLHHSALDQAVVAAGWRPVGNRRLFGPRQSSGPIDMLDAATCAHRGATRELTYDELDSIY